MLEIMIREVPPTPGRHDYKALNDMTRCLACRFKFSPDDIRSNVYNDVGCIGAIHEACYPFLGGPPERAPIQTNTSSPDASQDGNLATSGVTRR